MNKRQPLVSVFVVLGDNEERNQALLKSIETQTYPNIEIIKEIHNLDIAHGEYILIATCDDLYTPDAISGLIRVAQKNNSEVVLFNMEQRFESADDIRYSLPGGVMRIAGFREYEISGCVKIGASLLTGVNPMVGACLFDRKFLMRNQLKRLKDLDVFVLQTLLHNPRAFVLAATAGGHIIRPGTGLKTENDLLVQKIERFNRLLKYAKTSFKLRRWRAIISDILFYISTLAPVGDLSRLRSRTILPKCTVHLVDNCNLNCKSCDHFSCLAKGGDFELNINDFRRDIRRLHSLTRGRLEVLDLGGGEPLLHPNVLPFFKAARRAFPRSVIRLVTNGILLPQQSSKFWEMANRYRIIIAPTRYPIYIDWASVADVAHKYGVELDFFGGMGFCHKLLYHKPLDLCGEQTPVLSFINCQHTDGINLYRGHLYQCPVAAYIKYFNRQFGTELKTSSADSLDIYERGLKPQNVFDFFAKPTPFCRHCIPQATTYGHPWETTKKDISEWTLLRQQ